MKTIIVDDEYWALERVKQECAKDPEIEIVGTFQNSEKALEFAKENRVEFALLDIEMPGMSGLDFAKTLRALYPDVIVVFVTAHRQYLEDFIAMKADYFVFKPYVLEDIQDVLLRAKLLGGRLKNRVFIRTFGDFRVFVDGQPLIFSSQKAEELLALIVSKRGDVVNNKEGIDMLWDGRERDKQSSSAYRKTVERLENFLGSIGISDILISSIHGKALNVKKVDCDLLDLMNGNEIAARSFRGIFMQQYSWGEEFIWELNERKDEILRGIE